MRRFLDDEGRSWDVLVGKESWGTLVLLFSSTDGEVRKSVLGAETSLDAQAEAEALTEDDLRRRLADAVPW